MIEIIINKNHIIKFNITKKQEEILNELRILNKKSKNAQNSKGMIKVELLQIKAIIEKIILSN